MSSSPNFYIAKQKCAACFDAMRCSRLQILQPTFVPALVNTLDSRCIDSLTSSYIYILYLYLNNGAKYISARKTIMITTSLIEFCSNTLPNTISVRTTIFKVSLNYNTNPNEKISKSIA